MMRGFPQVEDLTGDGTEDSAARGDEPQGDEVSDVGTNTEDLGWGPHEPGLPERPDTPDGPDGPEGF